MATRRRKPATLDSSATSTAHSEEMTMTDTDYATDTAEQDVDVQAVNDAINGVTPDDEDVMPGRQGRKSSLTDSPVIGWLNDSLASGKAKSVPANDEDDAKATRALIRRAATHLGIGADTAVKQDGNGTWRCYFQARGKRAYTS